MPRFRDPSHTHNPSDAPRVFDSKNVKRASDPAVMEMIEKTQEKGIITAFDRAVAQQPQCQFGYKGTCCRFCMMGPCRVTADVGPKSKGICGADAWTIAARSTGVMLLTGAGAHCEHARHIAHTVLEAAEGKAPDYKITDAKKLHAVAKRQGIAVDGKADAQIAKELAEQALEDFRMLSGEDECKFLVNTITEGRKAKLDACNITTNGIQSLPTWGSPGSSLMSCRTSSGTPSSTPGLPAKAATRGVSVRWKGFATPASVAWGLWSSLRRSITISTRQFL